MLRKCSKKSCEIEVDYACECLSLNTYWCQFHLGEHLKLSNKTHTFDTIIAEPSQEINDSIFDFLEKEKSKIEKLKDIALIYLSPNLYNSKISIEETFKNLDYSLKEIYGLIKNITKSLKKIKDSNIKQLNNSELYQSRLCFILNQLKIKRSKILKSVKNKPNAEKDFRKACYLYKKSSSLYQVYHEYIEAHNKLASLYLIDENRANLYIYNTERESEKVKVLDIQKSRDKNACIAQLPNGELFYYSTPGNVYIIDKYYMLRKLPSCKANSFTLAIYFNRSVYCFGGKNNNPNLPNFSFRFDFEENIWIQFSPMINPYNNCSSVMFNGNILITGDNNSNILLYSIDIDSFSNIPYDFKVSLSKILINGEKRLYIIECGPLGSIFESEVDDEYTWKWIASSIIDDTFMHQIHCAYNKGGIYISISLEESSRHYFKFDLDQKSLTEIAFYNEYLAAKRSRSKYWDIKCYNQTFKFDSDDAKTYINKGHFLYDLGKLLKNIEHLNASIKRDPKYVDFYVKKGEALCELGRNLEAIECFNQAIKLNPNIVLNYLRKNKKILLDEVREAETIDCYNERIKNNPGCARGYIDKGNALCEFRRYFEAIECCNEAIIIDSKSFEAYLCKGNALSSLDRKSEAIECYNEAIKINPKDLNAYFYKSKILSELGRNFEVIECCNEGLKQKDNDVRLFMLKGKTFSQMGRNIEKNYYFTEVIKSFMIMMQLFILKKRLLCVMI